MLRNRTVWLSLGFFFLQLWILHVHKGALISSEICKFDCYWGQTVVERGYYAELPLAPGRHNLITFPAMPLVAFILGKIYRLEPASALVLTGHVFTLLFWFFFFSALKRMRVAHSAQILAGWLVVSHSGAFFFSVGYTESIFCAGLLFLIARFNSDDSRTWQDWLFGLFFSLTRILAMPMLFLRPLWEARLVRQPGGRKIFFRSSAFAVASIGSFLFSLVYCHFKWEHWNAYFILQKLGWNIKTDPRALLKPHVWTQLRPPSFPEVQMLERFHFSAFQASLYLWAVVLSGIFVAFAWRRLGQSRRAVFYWYVAAVILIVIPVLSTEARAMSSVLRYAFPVQICLVLLWAQLRQAGALANWPILLRRGAMLALCAWSVYTFATSWFFLKRHLSGDWVA